MMERRELHLQHLDIHYKLYHFIMKISGFTTQVWICNATIRCSSSAFDHFKKLKGRHFYFLPRCQPRFRTMLRSPLVKPIAIVVNVGHAGATKLDVIQEVEYVKQEAKIVYLLHACKKTHNLFKYFVRIRLIHS